MKMHDRKLELKQLLDKLLLEDNNELYEEAHATQETIENMLDFESAEQHQKWLEMLSSYSCWEDFYDFTMTIKIKEN